MYVCENGRFTAIRLWRRIETETKMTKAGWIGQKPLKNSTWLWSQPRWSHAVRVMCNVSDGNNTTAGSQHGETCRPTFRVTHNVDPCYTLPLFDVDQGSAWLGPRRESITLEGHNIISNDVGQHLVFIIGLQHTHLEQSKPWCCVLLRMQHNILIQLIKHLYVVYFNTSANDLINYQPEG